jgi:hypothetical protein
MKQNKLNTNQEPKVSRDYDLLEKEAARIITGKAQYQDIEVSVEPDPEMMEMLYLKANSLMNYGEDIDHDLFVKYIRTLFKFRVDVVNQRKIPQFARHVARVPSLIGLILAQIGPVTDDSYGVNLKPVCKIEDTLSENEMALISNILSKLDDKGFRSVQGVPKHYAGELGFMSTALNKDVIESYRHGTAPGMALLSCVARNQMLNVTLNMATQYGPYQEYISALRTVIFGGGNR